jgi:glycosyltransferase involved in cell wall biosynthesis
MVFMHVGRLAPEKNLEPVLLAYERIRQFAPRSKLVFVGDGPARAQLSQRCPSAIYAGMRHGNELAAYYASGDVFLFPSVTETFGNVTLEAMASGLAVVAYDYAAAAQHIRHSVSGVLAGFDDAEDFVRAAAALAATPERIARIGTAARATAEELSWVRVVGQFENLLLAAAGAQSAPATVADLETPAGAGL